jgi:hypothetical protein
MCLNGPCEGWFILLVYAALIGISIYVVGSSIIWLTVKADKRALYRRRWAIASVILVPLIPACYVISIILIHHSDSGTHHGYPL